MVASARARAEDGPQELGSRASARSGISKKGSNSDEPKKGTRASATEGTEGRVHGAANLERLEEKGWARKIAKGSGFAVPKCQKGTSAG